MSTVSNVIGRKEFRRVGRWTLDFLARVVMETFGPKASNTLMLSESTYNEYSKDGHTVLGEVKFAAKIEQSIKQDLNLLTLEIANTVGDGTTSAVILSSLIFDAFCDLEEVNEIRPYELMERFKNCVENIKEEILSRSQEFDADMAYKIAYIATNGNDWVAGQIKELYAKYGKDLNIDVMVSPNHDTYIREYDGLTLSAGYADSCFQNVEGKAVAEIRNAEVYAFSDPIDVPAMGDVFKAIIEKNITSAKTYKELVPTVILCPKIGYDYDFIMSNIAKGFLSCKEVEAKPPLLIVTNIPGNSLYDTIVNLSGAKWIKKFIDPKVKEQEAKEGNVATATNFQNFAGKCELVRADALKTVFINPKDMYETGDNGEQVLSKAYNTYLNNFKNEIAEAEKSTSDLNYIGNLRRKLHCLQSNMVDFVVGGITVGDRDSLRHLVEDAVKSCRSAAQYGVGYAANCEGLLATSKLIDDDSVISPILAKAYEELVLILYRTCLSEDDALKALADTKEKGMPMDLRAKEFNGNVLGSIMGDVVVLETISKIVSLIITCNQVILPETIYTANYTPKDVEE